MSDLRRGPITEPIYIVVRPGKVHQTKELVPGEVIADFDEQGRLLGVEILDQVGQAPA